MSHTPGPWMSQGIVVFAPHEDHIIAEATYVGGKIGFNQAVANARLIAAAPDLLAALRAIESAYDGSMTPLQAISRTMPVVRAAIGKAEGVQS